MKKLLVCIGIILTSCTSVKRHNEIVSSWHSVEALHEDVDKTYKQLKKIHPRLYQYISKKALDFKFDSLKQTIQKPLTSKLFYEKLAPVVREVKQGHISVTRPHKRFTKAERKFFKEKKFELSALSFESLDDKIWVKRTIGKDSSLIGCEVLKMGNEPVKELVNKYNGLIASDGYNTTLYHSFVGSRFLSFYYRDKGFLDSLQVTFKNKDSVFSKVFKRIDKKAKPKDSLNSKIDTLKVKKLSKLEKKEKKRKAKKKRENHNKYGYIASKKLYTRHFSLKGKDSSIAYMRIRGFTRGAYKDFYKESFKKIDSLKIQNLIIDLRDNGGGRLAEINNLYAYLTDKNYVFINESEVNSRIPFLKSFMSNTTPGGVKVFAALLSPFIITHNLIKTRKKEGKLYYKFRYSKLQEFSPLNFKGKIYVLINGNSFSASSILSTHLKANRRATFVGEETGGAYNGTVAGIYKRYNLPNSKVRINMGMMHIDAPHKIEPDGYGVKADIIMRPTRQDRIDNIDAELNWIIEDIELGGKIKPDAN